MRLLIIFCLLSSTLHVHSQTSKHTDTIPAINDYSNFKNKPQKKVYYKLFDKMPKDSSLAIIDGKIYRPDSLDISKFVNYRPKLVNKIIDNSSTSGIKYIYIYKSD